LPGLRAERAGGGPPDPQDVALDDRFFAREAGRLLAALTRVFGVQNLALAEDVVQETLAKAFEEWSFHGVPAYSSALLLTAAKNRALDVLRRQRTARKFAPELGRMLESEWTLRPAVEELFLPRALKDDELRMMFSCCHPRLQEDVQVALILNILCGFGVDEIASAFLVTPAAVEKRLTRGKKVLAGSKRLFELTAADFLPRLSAVQRALYLLFNEGYHGASPKAVVRLDLCREAMRLVRLLVDHAPSATPATQALAALLFLDAARLHGRIDEAGNLKALFEQDRSRWDGRLIAEGLKLLDASATGDELTPYHLEARIAGLHAAAARAEETPWGEIVALYHLLMKVRPSPVVALNRAMAIAQHEGPAAGLVAIRAIAGTERLARYPFYPAAQGELALRLGRAPAAEKHFRAALRLARNDGERRFLERRIADCERASPG
jgi:RNA polymerase sigma factor (sigma-70 family)